MINDTILITGSNVSRQHAHNLLSRGDVERLGRGIYVKIGLSEDERRKAILSHACRIAAKLYPASVLSSVSSWHLEAANGALYIVSPNSSETINIGGVLSIHVSRLGYRSSIPSISIRSLDPIGSFEAKTLAPEVAFIFEMSGKDMLTEPQKYGFSVEELTEFVRREIAFSGKDSFKRSVLFAAKIFGLKMAADSAISFIDRATIRGNKKDSVGSYAVFWHKKLIGTISPVPGRGGELFFSPEDDYNSEYFNTKDKQSGLPAIFSSLMREYRSGRDGSVITLSQMKRGERYLSNIDMVEITSNNDYSLNQIKDSEYITGTIEKYSCEDGVWFTGKFKDPFPDISLVSGSGCPRDQIATIKDIFWNIERVSESASTPKIPGMQPKLPMNLDAGGVLSIANDGKFFTHILKYPNNKSLDKCVNEFYVTRLAESIGISTQKTALINIPLFGAALLMERFDIRRGGADRTKLLCSDFMSVSNLLMMNVNSKYGVSIETLCKSMMEKSSNKTQDSIQILRQIAYSWVIGNGDMHAKNLSMLVTDDNKRYGAHSVRMSPAYDLLSTQVEPRYSHNLAALPIGDSLDYSAQSFSSLSSILEMSEESIFDVVNKIASSVIDESLVVGAEIKSNKNIMANEAYISVITRIEEVARLKSSGIINSINEYKKSKKQTADISIKVEKNENKSRFA